MKIPNTERFCTHCVNYTIWKFEPNVGHSSCTVCGLRMCCISKQSKIIRFIDEYFDKKIIILQNEIEYLKHKKEALIERTKKRDLDVGNAKI